MVFQLIKKPVTNIVLNCLFISHVMPAQLQIEKLGQSIVDYFITNNNKISWIAKISKDLNKNVSNVAKQIKKLENISIIIKINCPDKLVENIKGERGKKGGSYPSGCYRLNHDMNPEWFVEIARPHLDNDDKNTRLDFMESGTTSAIIHKNDFINWIIKNKICFDLKQGRDILPIIFNSFPSTLRWVLYGDLSSIREDKCEKEFQERTFLSFLNGKIIEDLLNKTYLTHKNLAYIDYLFSTRFILEDLKLSNAKKEERVHREIKGFLGVSFEEISDESKYKEEIKKRINSI